MMKHWDVVRQVLPILHSDLLHSSWHRRLGIWFSRSRPLTGWLATRVAYDSSPSRACWVVRSPISRPTKVTRYIWPTTASVFARSLPGWATATRSP